MRFVINQVEYIVTIAGRPLFVEGEAAKARIDPARRRIELSDQLARPDRQKALFHELRHAWVMLRGIPAGEEADALDAGEMMSELFTQFINQGGVAALELLDPIPERTQRMTKMVSGPQGNTSAACGACGCAVMCGSIVNGQPEWDAWVGAHTIERGMCCPACDKITAWRETANEQGMPLGAIIAFPPPRVLRGADAVQWIARHAEFCNVIVA